jgi:Ca2+-binding EF-hand superfamily protein
MIRKSRPVPAPATLGCAAALLLAITAPAAAQSESRVEQVVRPIFDRYDRNSDGIITETEFMQVGQGDFATLDADKDSALSKHEFLDPKPRGAGQLDGANLARARQMWRQQFAFLDADKNGRVTAAEHESAGAQSFRRMDADGNSKVTLQEMMAVAGQ